MTPRRYLQSSHMKQQQQQQHYVCWLIDCIKLSPCPKSTVGKAARNAVALP